MSGDLSISNLWATKLRDLFSSQDVTERDNLHADVMNNISPSDLANLNVSPDSVLECIGHLKHGKFNGTSLSFDFLIYAAPVIADAHSHSPTWLCSRFTSRLSYSQGLK